MHNMSNLRKRRHLKAPLCGGPKKLARVMFSFTPSPTDIHNTDADRAARGLDTTHIKITECPLLSLFYPRASRRLTAFTALV